MAKQSQRMKRARALFRLAWRSSTSEQQAKIWRAEAERLVREDQKARERSARMKEQFVAA